MDFKQAVSLVVENGACVNLSADLAIYKCGGNYCVEYWFDETTINLLNLTEEQKSTIKEDEELLEFFDNVDSAVEFCFTILDRPIPTFDLPPKRTLMNKIKDKASGNDDYF